MPLLDRMEGLHGPGRFIVFSPCTSWELARRAQKTMLRTQPATPNRNRLEPLASWPRAMFVAVILAAALAAAGPARPAHLAADQAASAWSDPVRISERGRPTWFPLIAASDDGVMHAVWAQDDQENRLLGSSFGTIYYSALRDSKWSTPVDIFVAPVRDTAALAGLRIDQSGRLHLLWFSGQGMTYGNAAASKASSAREWWATRIAESASAADLAVTANGVVHLTYSVAGRGIYHMRSDDLGRHWTAPYTVWAEPDAFHASGSVRIATDSAGAVHVVWSVNAASSGWRPESVGYARSLDGGRTWDQRLDVTDGDTQPNLGFDGQGRLHIVWNNPVESALGRGHTWSADGGRTWQAIERLLPGYRGSTLWPSMATDSAGTLHLVTAADSPDVYHPRVFHSTWRDGKWTEFDLVSASSRNAEAPALAVTGGNQLHVVWHFSGSGDPDESGIWYSAAMVDAPAVAPRPLPTAPPATATPGATAGIPTTPTALAAAVRSTTPASNVEESLGDSATPWLPYAAGMFPPALMVIFYLALRARRQSG